MKTNTVPVEYLHECFEYDPDTGVLAWKERPAHHFKCAQSWRRFVTQFSGKSVGSIEIDGKNSYLSVRLNKRGYRVHRIAYAMYHGCWPDCDIDHFNGNGLDNRASNLRPADNSLNSRNSRMWGHNKSGVTGVCWSKSSKKWEAYINVEKKQRHIGLFSDLESAIKARAAAEKGQGYTKRHGKLSESQ